MKIFNFAGSFVARVALYRTLVQAEVPGGGLSCASPLLSTWNAGVIAGGAAAIFSHLESHGNYDEARRHKDDIVLDWSQPINNDAIH